MAHTGGRSMASPRAARTSKCEGGIMESILSRFGADVQSGDAERERMPMDAGQTVPAQPRRHGFAVREFEHAGGQVMIGVVLAPRNCLAEPRQDLAKIELVQTSE